ncbi:CAF17-like 4Fe-4S cluster assembly/insertion protein YgfZ [Nitrincola alkalisediminis]|uniref:CAF17-like 4Fe-4S cluster assembly/insertion protein YgfZ n=1 Tax=Nitrincola alkalisediminis TaxID=1366656 RepID=UPI0018763BD5|nr:folate-binding protein YgfZ [Nitrincola alkalisediminis]
MDLSQHVLLSHLNGSVVNGLFECEQPASSSNCCVTPLIHQTLLSVEGPDAHTFLQGQLSCDLREVDQDGSRLGTHCNIKGHIVSLYRVMRSPAQGYWLRVHHDMADTGFKLLKKYSIFSKVSLQPLFESHSGLGFSGASALACLEHCLGQSLAMEEGSFIRHADWTLTRTPGNRYELWATTETLVSLLPEVLTLASPAPTEQWILQDIEQGLPDIRPETQESFIPQMVNLQVFKGISFNKGCYTGQEIVTRLQHRGQLKKPMYRAQVSAKQAPLPGSLINSDSKEGVGQVVLAAASNANENQYEVLAVINKASAENEHLFLPTGEPISLLELPYQLDPRLFESKR